jgi:hypothetical protein
VRLIHRLVGGYVAVVLVAMAPRYLAPLDWPADRWAPVGPLSWMSGPPSSAVVLGLFAASVGSAILVVLDRQRRHAGLVLAVAFTALATWRVSWGHVLHTDHLVAVHALILGVGAWLTPRRFTERDVIRLLQLVTVVAYVLAGVAKLRASGIDWASGDLLRNQVAFDNLRKELLGDPHSPIASLVGIDAIWTPFAVMALVVELGAPIALLGRRWAAGWAVTAWAFHVGVLALMAITFAYPLSGVAFAAFLVGNPTARTVLARWRGSLVPRAARDAHRSRRGRSVGAAPGTRG